LLVKIEFKTGSWLLVNAGDMFQSDEECRKAFMELLDGDAPYRFVKLDDFQGKKLIINRENINSIEVGYQKGAGEKYRPKQ